MTTPPDHQLLIELNRRHWDERAVPHAVSPDYRVAELIADPGALSDVVRFDRPRLGDLQGLRGVHLQCHIGTDTVSLARLGARMTGLDFSPESIAQARDLAAQTDADVNFVHATVYAALDAVGGGFDFVYTGVGALCWLPDIARWASIVANMLAPGGRLFLREGHPMLWSLADPRPDGLLVVEYPYVETAAATLWDEPGTYVDSAHRFTHTRSANWSHGLGDIVTALLGQGLAITMLVEHDSVPWNAMPGQMTALPNGEFRLTDRPERLPHTYTLHAVKPAP